MGLKIRDAISADSMSEYDKFMAGVADSSFLSLEHKDDVIIVNEYDNEDDSIFRAGKFKANEMANAYFEQERKMAVEMGLIDVDERA